MLIGGLSHYTANCGVASVKDVIKLLLKKLSSLRNTTAHNLIFFSILQGGPKNGALYENVVGLAYK